MIERLRNAAWGLGVAVLHAGKRLGISGPFERAAIRLATHVIKPPLEETEVTLPWSTRLSVPPGFPRARSYAAGRYEPELTKLLQEIVRPGMCVVDVGAFCGYYTLLASHLVGPTGRVYAFEPDPANYAYLLKNVQANECTNARLLRVAVSDRVRDVTFMVHAEADHGWVSPASPNGPRVPATTLDAFFEREGWPRVDLVKMDIEGAEGAALRGMKELVVRNPGMHLIMEFDLDNLLRYGATRQSVAETLADLGFNEGLVIEQTRTFQKMPESLPQTRGTYNLLLVGQVL